MNKQRVSKNYEVKLEKEDENKVREKDMKQTQNQIMRI